MRARDAVRSLAAHAGMTLYDVSRACGQAVAWARVSADRDGVQLETVARVADACGCDVALIDRETGEELGRIEPPPRGE